MASAGEISIGLGRGYSQVTIFICGSGRRLPTSKPAEYYVRWKWLLSLHGFDQGLTNMVINLSVNAALYKYEILSVWSHND